MNSISHDNDSRAAFRDTEHDPKQTKSCSDLNRWRREVTLAATLSPTAKHIALTLSIYFDGPNGAEPGGNAFVSYARLATDTGRSEATVWRALQELEREHYLTSQERSGRHRGRGRRKPWAATIPGERINRVDASHSDDDEQRINRVDEAPIERINRVDARLPREQDLEPFPPTPQTQGTEKLNPKPRAMPLTIVAKLAEDSREPQPQTRSGEGHGSSTAQPDAGRSSPGVAATLEAIATRLDEVRSGAGWGALIRQRGPSSVLAAELANRIDGWDPPELARAVTERELESAKNLIACLAARVKGLDVTSPRRTSAARRKRTEDLDRAIAGCDLCDDHGLLLGDDGAPILEPTAIRCDHERHLQEAVA